MPEQHTILGGKVYIYVHLMEGADIYQIAKNCGTSVEMIEKYYAAHIKTSLDAAAINVMRTRKPRKRKKDSQDTQPLPPGIEETEISSVTISTTSV